MKYTLYRSFGKLDNDVMKHELAAVEYGADIYCVTDALIRDVADDLAEMPEYAGCETTAFAPEPVQPFHIPANMAAEPVTSSTYMDSANFNMKFPNNEVSCPKIRSVKFFVNNFSVMADSLLFPYFFLHFLA